MHEQDEDIFTVGGLTYDEICERMKDDRGYITYTKDGFRYDHPSRMARRAGWDEGRWVVQARAIPASYLDEWPVKWWIYDGKSIGDTFEADEADKEVADWIYTNDMSHDMVLLTPLCFNKPYFDIEELEAREAEVLESKQKFIDALLQEEELREEMERTNCIYALLIGAAAGMLTAWLYWFFVHNGVL